MEDVEAAEAQMESAKNTLLRYIESRETIDRDRHQQLVARLKKAQAEFLRAISELGK
jgi:hypothetical protein